MPVVRHNDELRDLAESINRMASQLADYEAEVRRSERLKTLGQLGASMAHQLRNAATGGRMAIELHRRECPQEAADESLEVALRQLRLMESYLRQFLSIEPSAPAVRRPVDAAQLVEEVLGLVRPSYLHAGVELAFTPPAERLVLEGDAEALRQLVTNLVLNALDAALTGETVPPRVLVDVLRSADGHGLLRVRRYGPRPGAGGPRPVVPLPREHQARRFRPGAVRRPPDRRAARRASELDSHGQYDLLCVRVSARTVDQCKLRECKMQIAK